MQAIESCCFYWETLGAIQFVHVCMPIDYMYCTNCCVGETHIIYCLTISHSSSQLEYLYTNRSCNPTPPSIE